MKMTLEGVPQGKPTRHEDCDGKDASRGYVRLFSGLSYYNKP